MTKLERMRRLLIDVRAYLRNRSMDGVYEQGRREGLLDAINKLLDSPDEPSEEPEPCVSHIAMKEYEQALERIIGLSDLEMRDGDGAREIASNALNRRGE